MKRISLLGAAVTLALPLIVMPSVLVVPSVRAESTPPLTCQPGTGPTIDMCPGTIVMANNFESGSLAGFVVQTSGSGTASVSSAQAYGGSSSAYLHTTSEPGSMANISTVLPPGTREAYADAWFNITRAGLPADNIPYFRFFSGNTRFADTYRDNDNGQLWLRVLTPRGSFTYTPLGESSVSLNVWHHMVMHVSPNGSSTKIEVWFDGAQVYSNAHVDTVTSSVTRVQNGAEHYAQMGDEYIDDLIVKSVTN